MADSMSVFEDIRDYFDEVNKLKALEPFSDVSICMFLIYCVGVARDVQWHTCSSAFQKTKVGQ